MSKAGKVDDAIRYWGYVEQFYTNSNFYAAGLLQLAQNYEKKGDRDAAKAYYKKYLPVETSPANRNVAQMQLAQMFQKDGLDILTGSENIEDEAERTKAEKTGMVQIINAIKQFTDLAAQSAVAMQDSRMSEAERTTLDRLREGSLFLAAQCRGRLGQSLKKIGKVEIAEKQMLASATA